jgi:hypothetical protein
MNITMIDKANYAMSNKKNERNKSLIFLRQIRFSLKD